jgi:D-glycero-D-manno-heptose 1,7-bisphosphate phosphatase
VSTAASTSGRGLRRSLVLLDRDGVINEDVGSPGVCHVDDFRLVPGAAAAIAKLKRAGATVCVVTNQTCVGKGLVTELELDGIHRRMRDLLREEGGEDASIDSIHVATTVSTIPCDRRKPSPGMVLEAMAAHGFAPDDTCFVGDTATDMQAAFRAGAGVTRVLVGTGYGEPVYEALLRVSAETETEGDDANVGGWMAKEKTKKRFVVDVPKADPTDTIPRETLPVTVCANVEEAADMLLETRVVEVEL